MREILILVPVGVTLDFISKYCFCLFWKNRLKVTSLIEHNLFPWRFCVDPFSCQLDSKGRFLVKLLSSLWIEVVVRRFSIYLVLHSVLLSINLSKHKINIRETEKEFCFIYQYLAFLCIYGNLLRNYSTSSISNKYYKIY